MVDDSLKTQLVEIEKFKENLLQKILIQQYNMVELEKENESLQQNIGGAKNACAHEEDIICLKRELEEEKMKENVLANQLEYWKEKIAKNMKKKLLH